MKISAVALSVAMAAACETVTGGAGGTAIQGSAGGASSEGASNVEHCDETLGTLAVDDGREKAWYGDWSRRTGVTSVEPMIRLMAQQSNCFIITSIGSDRLDSKMSAITQKQRNSGEFREGSKQEAGQRVAADYFLEPTIMFASADGGAIGAAAASFLPGVGAILAKGAMKTSNTQVTLSLFDIRSGVQIAISEGSASTNNLGFSGGIWGGAGAGALGGYTKTPEGKSTVAAFLDGYNGMVKSLKNYKAQTVKGGSGKGGALKVN